MDSIGMQDSVAKLLQASLSNSLLETDNDGLSTPASAYDGADVDDTNTDEAIRIKQEAALKTYMDSVPYDCESPEEMDKILSSIVGKIYVAAESNRVEIQRKLDEALNTWVALKYPLSKATRIKLLKYYYDLCMIPSEKHLVHERVAVFLSLLPHKRDSILALGTEDLVLNWRPLWRLIEKELWPMKRLLDPQKNVADIYLHLAEACKRFFPRDQIKPLLDTFLPLLSPATHLSITPVIASFLPLCHPEEYLPAVFAIWEAFNSKTVDDRFIELTGSLAEEHVHCSVSPSGEVDVKSTLWKDVGIYTNEQWLFLMSKLMATWNDWITSTKGKGGTSSQADHSSVKNGARIKKAVNRQYEFSKLIVYSISVDGPIKKDTNTDSGLPAGSTALDSLEKIILGKETLFHPSSAGPWTFMLADFMFQLTSEFCKRRKEEEDQKCKTPLTQRLNRRLSRAFVSILRAPILLLLFAKDPLSLGFAQGAIRKLAFLEPDMIMPQVLERAINGLEIINETHRTTAALGMLSSVALPLVSAQVWFGGQRHLVPLLELSLPGIDLNDPSKAICTTNFIQSVVQHIKIGDLSMHAHYTGALAVDDDPSGQMDVDEETVHMPGGLETFQRLSREEEWTLARENTAGFADWVTSLFRRVFSLYENLPEEGGRRGTTGGKTEEAVLKSIKNMLDVVCLHLSEPLFDLVLKIVYEYVTSTTRANAVRAISQMIACLARTNPEKTIDRFLPYCAEQIKEELKHGASSIATTSSHSAVPSDTTLHWNISVLRGCLGYGGPVVLKHKEAILDLLAVLIEKTKGERGYSGTGRLIIRLLSTLSAVYPLNSRFVNSSDWDSEEFDKNHIAHWGRFYEASEVVVEWHVPCDDEVFFVIEIMDKIIGPLVGRLQELLKTTKNWGSTERNDFCRFLNAVRSAWQGLSTLLKEVDPQETLRSECDSDIPELYPTKLGLKAGFTLTDPHDPRHKTLKAHRDRFGSLVHEAAAILGGNVGSEDHIDAVSLVLKSIDVYMLDYATSKAGYAALRKIYVMARDIMRMWPRQKQSTRLVFLKRAQVYHNLRLSTHSVFRRRDSIGVKLTENLMELSLSPYTRVRRNAQAILEAVSQCYPLNSRSVILRMTENLARGTDPDRMKGALYVLSSSSTRNTLRYDPELQGIFMNALLECQHQEKPSIQKLVPSVHTDFCSHCISEESLRTPSAIENHKDFFSSLKALCEHLAVKPDDRLLSIAGEKSKEQVTRNKTTYEKIITNIVGISRRPTTHWRYLHMGIQYLVLFLRRDVPQDPEVAKLFVKTSTTAHVSTRGLAQKGLITLLALVKIRSYSQSEEELWFEEWKNPFQTDLQVKDPQRIKAFIQAPFIEGQDLSGTPFIDKITSGFLAWRPTLKGYMPPTNESRLDAIWEESSRPALQAIRDMLQTNYLTELLTLWAQESDTRSASSTDLILRADNISFVKSLAKSYESECLERLLPLLESMITDSDRFKQRAAAEALAGLIRGSKHWSLPSLESLWSWCMSRFDAIFNSIKPDTAAFWDSFFRVILAARDPRRNKALIDKILARNIDFQSDSAFMVTKSLDTFVAVAEETQQRFGGIAHRYIKLLFENADTNFEEIRGVIAQTIAILMSCEWSPTYPSVQTFLDACRDTSDPLKIRQGKHAKVVTSLVMKLPAWKEERLPPPRVNQSQFDKVALTVLLWMWNAGHSVEANLIFPYIVPMIPEIMNMTDLNDNQDLVAHSSSVLYILSAMTVPHEYIPQITEKLTDALKSSQSWKMKRMGLVLMTFFLFRNILSLSQNNIEKSLEAVIACLYDENLEVSETAEKLLSDLLRSSQRHRIIPLRDRFVAEIHRARLPKRQDPEYTSKLRALHAGILGICSLIESFPYTIEPWMPPLTEVLSPHASDPPPISSTIRKCASQFKKTHQDTWHIDERAFTPDQLQDLSTMLIGTSYCAHQWQITDYGSSADGISIKQMLDTSTLSMSARRCRKAVKAAFMKRKVLNDDLLSIEE